MDGLDGGLDTPLDSAQRPITWAFHMVVVLNGLGR